MRQHGSKHGAFGGKMNLFEVLWLFSLDIKALVLWFFGLFEVLSLVWLKNNDIKAWTRRVRFWVTKKWSGDF